MCYFQRIIPRHHIFITRVGWQTTFIDLFTQITAQDRQHFVTLVNLVRVADAPLHSSQQAEQSCLFSHLIIFRFPIPVHFPLHENSVFESIGIDIFKNELVYQ